MHRNLLNLPMITYKKGDLFSVSDSNAVLCHAVNCKGKWGSGIAVEFKERFPKAHTDYKALCKLHGKELLGLGFYYYRPCDGGPRIAYLFTSNDYGENKDSERKILRNTQRAVTCLLSVVKDGAQIHSPKINSGKFDVPWEKTAAVLEKCLRAMSHINVTWTVWEQT